MGTEVLIHRNVSTATAAAMARILGRGAVLSVRNQEIRELRNQLTIVLNPLERCLFVPYRQNNIFVAVAETLWVLAGRNDVAWLQPYLPRAAEFSDDGLTWRGGYGPRLRNWGGVDQLDKARELLLEETATRRAAMVLFDPAQDFVASKDVPCNNWLHWLIRDGKLYLNVAIRSNDVVWGFSGVNCFEWSVLHEMMAFWVGMEVGEATYFASSFHIYSRHYAMAETAIRAFKGITCYDFGLIAPQFRTEWHDFSKTVKTWFEMEAEVRKFPGHSPTFENYLSDPFLLNVLWLLRLYHGDLRGWDSRRLQDELSNMPATDLTAAAYEFFSRKHPELLNDIRHESISAFLRAFTCASLEHMQENDLKTVFDGIKRLHQQKSAAYGAAWKRRGELTSILANIARKVDRLAEYGQTGFELGDETIFDTVIDLFVYSVKYVLYLLERLPGRANEALPANAPQPFSDHVANFNWIIDHLKDSVSTPFHAETLENEIAATFEDLHALAQKGDPSLENRLEVAIKLRDLAFALAQRFLKARPDLLSALPRIDLI